MKKRVVITYLNVHRLETNTFIQPVMDLYHNMRRICSELEVLNIDLTSIPLSPTYYANFPSFANTTELRTFVNSLNEWITKNVITNINQSMFTGKNAIDVLEAIYKDMNISIVCEKPRV